MILTVSWKLRVIRYRKTFHRRLLLRPKRCLFFILLLNITDSLAQTCPYGSPTASTGYGITAIGGAANPANATGTFLAAGSTLSVANSATLSTTVYLVIDFQKWIAQGSTITVSWQRISGTPTASVEVSNDNSTFVSLGNLTGTSSTPATSAYVNFTIPAGGVRYVRILQTAGSAYVDGVRYTHTCYFPVNAFNDTRVFMNPGKARGNIALNDLNFDNDSIIYSLAYVNVANGVLTFGNNGNYTYTPNASFDGVDYFSYRVCDAGPDRLYYTTADNTCDTAIVTFRSLFNCDSTRFYIPMPENEAMDFMKDIKSSNTDPVQLYTGLSVSSDAIVIYDQWEDGFESDIKSPSQTSTLIWGDGDLTNGIAPGFPTDILDPGKAIILSNTLSSGHSGSTAYDPNAAASDATLQATVDYDGKDKIFVGGLGALAKFAWGSAGTVSMTGASVPATKTWDTLYTLPVGQNTTGGGVSFEIANLSIMAKENYTIIRIDRDANGTIDIRDTLDEGETRYVDSRFNGATVAVNQGGTVRSNKPVMVTLMTGDFQVGGMGYEGRTYSLIPNARFSTCYYMPGIPQENMRVFFYNPTSSAITVTRTTTGGATSTIAVAANSSNYEDVNNSGLGYRYCSTAGFAILCSVDHSSATSDWGFSPLPANSLTSKVLMSVGPGCDPFNASYGTENDDQALVTVDSTTYLYVDINGDGLPDKVSFNSDVDATDGSVTIGGVNYNETTSDAGILMNAYQAITIGSTNGTLDGATFWTKTGPNNTGSEGKKINLVWGQNGGPNGAPNIDAGYTVSNIMVDISNILIKSSDSICEGNNTDSIKVIFQGATSPYKVLWYNETTNTFAKFNTNEDSFTILNLEPGSYLIKVKDANCRNLTIRTQIFAKTVGCIFDITGTVYNDANGMVNGLIDGTGKGSLGGTTLYIYLVNSSGNIVDSSRVNSDGTYILRGARAISYTARLSTVVAGIGSAAPAANLPSRWVNTGEQYGSNNGAGTGLESGTADGVINITVGTTNIASVDFGLERTPIAHSKTYLVSPDSILYKNTGHPEFTKYVNLYDASGTSDTNVNSASTLVMPGRISGSDLEDGRIIGTSGVYGKLALTALPDTAIDGVLVYNGILLYPNPVMASPAYAYWNTANSRYEIPNFKPDSLRLFLKVAYQSGTSFSYAFIDNANRTGQQVTYQINYPIPLPLNIIFRGKLEDKVALLDWECMDNEGILAFELKRKYNNNRDLVHVATVKDTGNSHYFYNDNLIEQPSGIYIYYLNSVNKAGDKKAEGTVALNLNAVVNRSVILSPNPASKMTYLNFIGYENNLGGTIEIYTCTGILTESIRFSNNNVPINTENLSAGIYTLNIMVEGQSIILFLAVYN